MPDEIQQFTEYACSLGVVIGHTDNPAGYRISTNDSRVVGILANGEPSPDNVETDIANPAAPVLSEAEIWANFLDGYVTVEGPNGPLNLKANLQARNDFIGQDTLLKSGLELGEITSETMISLWDKDNVEHPMTVAQCRLTLFRYGYGWHLAFTQLAP
jgi:hypothetical protein